MTVRRAKPGDEPAILEACRQFVGDGTFDPSSFLRWPGAYLLLADEAGETVGWVYGQELIHPDGERTMLLYSLDVSERARRRGHGRALVEAFVSHARSSGCTEVWVLTDGANPAAAATYVAAGAVRVSTPAVMFTWRLAPGRHSG